MNITMELIKITDSVLAKGQAAREIVSQILQGGLTALREEEGQAEQSISRVVRDGFPDAYEDRKRLDAALAGAEGIDGPACSALKTQTENAADLLTAVRLIADGLNTENSTDGPGIAARYSMMSALAGLDNRLGLQLEKLRNLKIQYAQNTEEAQDPQVEDGDGSLPDLWEDTDFYGIYLTLENLFAYYQTVHPDTDTEKFHQYVRDALRRFTAGEEFEDFSFYLEFRDGDEIVYHSFASERTSITVSCSGHSWRPDIGGARYTDWIFTIGRDGKRVGFLGLDLAELKTQIDRGAAFVIELPDAYSSYDNDF